MIIQLLTQLLAKAFCIDMPTLDPMRYQVGVKGSCHLLDGNGWRLVRIDSNPARYGFGCKYGKLVIRLGYDNSPMPRPGVMFTNICMIRFDGRVYP